MPILVSSHSILELVLEARDKKGSANSRALLLKISDFSTVVCGRVFGDTQLSLPLR